MRFEWGCFWNEWNERCEPTDPWWSSLDRNFIRHSWGQNQHAESAWSVSQEQWGNLQCKEKPIGQRGERSDKICCINWMVICSFLIHFFLSSPPCACLLSCLFTQFKFIVVVRLLSPVWLFVTPWTAARQASLSFTISWSLLRLMPIELMMPSNYLILCCSLLLLPSVFPSVRVFASDSALCIKWPKY